MVATITDYVNTHVLNKTVKTCLLNTINSLVNTIEDITVYRRYTDDIIKVKKIDDNGNVIITTTCFKNYKNRKANVTNHRNLNFDNLQYGKLTKYSYSEVIITYCVYEGIYGYIYYDVVVGLNGMKIIKYQKLKGKKSIIDDNSSMDDLKFYDSMLITHY